MRTRIITIAAIALLVVVLSFFAYKRFFRQVAEPFNAVPADAAIVFHFPESGSNFRQLQDSVWNPVRGRGFLARLFADIELLDTMFGYNQQSRRFLEEAPALASLHKTGATGLDLLWIIGKGSSGNAGSESLTDSLPGPWSEHTFRGVRIRERSAAEGSLALARIKGLLLISRSPYLIERAIVQLKDEPSIVKGGSLSKVIEETSRNDDPKMYVQFSRLAELLSVSFDVAIGAENPLTTLAGWGGADFHLIGKKLLLNGVVEAGAGTRLGVIEPLPSESADLAMAMPASTATFCIIRSNHVTSLERFEANAGLHDLFARHFVNWMTSSVALVISEPLTDKLEDYTFIVIPCEDTVLAIHDLLELVRIQSDVEFAEPVDARHDIYRLDNFEELELLLGLPTQLLHSPAFAQFGDFIIFGKSVPALGIYLDHLKAGHTLANDVAYLAFRDNFNAEAHLDWYFRPGLSRNVLLAIARDEAALAPLVGMEPVGLQFTYLKEHLFLANCVIDVTGGAAPVRTSGALAAVWRYKLDTVAVMRPVIVRNTRTNEDNVFVQDVDNTIYLFSKAGELLWKRELGSKIVGAVHQVDYFRNGKLQIMFATERAIHLIDILSRDVGEFPLRLPAASTSGLMIARYEDEELPRMFVACANGNIYGYKLTGEPLPGWNPKRNVGRIPYPMQHIVHDSKDYISITKGDGSHLLLNRLGENRRAPTSAVSGLLGEFKPVIVEGKMHFLAVASSGALLKVDPSGRMTTDSLDIAGTAMAFTVADLDGDKKDELLVADTSSITVFDLAGDRIGSFPVARASVLFDVAGGVGAFSLASGEAWQLVSDHVDARFPVSASAPFEIGELLGEGDEVVVVCSPDGWVTGYRL